MYASSSNESGLLLGVLSGACTDRDYEASLADVARVDSQAASRNIPYVHVLVTDKDVPLTPPQWRKRFAESNRLLKSDQHYFVLVTTSALSRGVYTAVLWLTTKRHGHHFHAVPCLREAQRWLESELGGDYGYLENLELSVRRSAVRLIPKQDGVLRDRTRKFKERSD